MPSHLNVKPLGSTVEFHLLFLFLIVVVEFGLFSVAIHRARIAIDRPHAPEVAFPRPALATATNAGTCYYMQPKRVSSGGSAIHVYTND